MPSPVWEDLSEFFDPDEFAVSATIKRDEATLGEVLGVFEHPTERADLGEFELDQTSPRFICAAVALTLSIVEGDMLTIEDTEYDVLHRPEQDGTGLVAVILAEQAGLYDAGL